jgi:hypothetical protein
MTLKSTSMFIQKIRHADAEKYFCYTDDVQYRIFANLRWPSTAMLDFHQMQKVGNGFTDSHEIRQT